MTVLCNGIPKAGTHALLKAVQLLGMSDTVHDHIPYGEQVPKGKHIYIRRNPRNVLISWVRFTHDVVTKGFLIGAIKQFGNLGWSLPLTYANFDGWAYEDGVLTVDFELLVMDDQEMKRIAKYLDVPYLDDAFDNLEGGTPTWTGQLSNWRDYWSVEVECEWDREWNLP